MNATLALQNGKAKSATAILGNKKPRLGNISSQLSELMKEIFSDKPWAHVASFIKSSPRAAKHKLYEGRRYSADEVAALLRTEHGRQVLSVLMGKSKPRWYARLLEQDAVADAHLFALKADERLKAAVAVRDELTAAIARTETALVIQDEAFHRNDIDGLREARGVRSGTLAETKRK